MQHTQNLESIDKIGLVGERTFQNEFLEMA